MLTGLTRRYFLRLVIDKDSTPFLDDIIDCSHAVRIGLRAISRQYHPIRVFRQRVMQTDARQRIDIPIYDVIRCIRSRLRGSRVREDC